VTSGLEADRPGVRSVQRAEAVSSADLVIRPGPGLPAGLVIPAAELKEQFSRSSGPGGQSVNTTDSRVRLRWSPSASAALTEPQLSRLLGTLANRLVDGAVVTTGAEHRSQWANRNAARERLADLLRTALQPPSRARRARQPSHAARQRRLDAKRRRGELKQGRGRIPEQ
jgi:ribosome-associated protein